MLINFVPNVITSNCVKFVSYTGKWPCLCMGLLTLNIEGKEVTFGHDFEHNHEGEFEGFWESGGGLDEDYSPVVGPWKIDVQRLPEQLQQYAFEIDKVFNDNVMHGCCGGCA